MYANPACPAADPCDLLHLLHGPHRVGCRLVMILLSQQGFAATQIADLLGYDPSTVRRWIHRYQHHGTAALADRPRSGRPRLGRRGWRTHWGDAYFRRPRLVVWCVEAPTTGEATSSVVGSIPTQGYERNFWSAA